jgi:putative membrane protein
MPLRELFGVFLKGAGMGAANVIPGVSGGTIALITGIYGRLIQALRDASQPDTIRDLLSGQWARAWKHFDGNFLVALGVGVVVSILTLARLFDYLLANYEVPTMAFFFGLVLVSIIHVGGTVPKWDGQRVAALVFGTVIAAGLAFVAPAEPNAAFWYLFLCGMAAICSMILPGLSGSFVLMLMGNYILVIRAIKEFDIGIIIPMAVGCGAGLLGFVQVLGWALKKAPHTVIALMTGIVLGSLLTIWPWKVPLVEKVEVAGELKDVITGYSWRLPAEFDGTFILAFALMIGGGCFLHFMQKFAQNEGSAEK